MKLPKVRKRHVIIAVAIVILGLAVGVRSHKTTQPIFQPTNTASTSAIPVSGCDQSLWNHVYHPQRLQIIEDCKTVTGTIEVIRNEADSDNHILVKLDNGFLEITNNPIFQGNVKNQHGDLIVETICTTGKVTQADAIQACQGFNQSFSAIKVGAHLRITGAFVNDTQHNWLELHPITSVEVL